MNTAVRYFAPTLGLLLLFPFSGPAGEAEQELEKLQGTWQAVAGWWGTAPGTPQELRATTFTIRGDKWRLRDEGPPYVILLDPTTEPKQFDRVETDGRSAGNRRLGIYKWDGDRLTIAFSSNGIQRPSGFSPKDLPRKELPGLATVVLERVKP
jgi:uncharacterized protein (TIGR03067 family)